MKHHLKTSLAAGLLAATMTGCAAADSHNAIQTGLPGPLLALIIAAVVILAIWDAVWKLIALWKSARNDQLVWFICLAIFNTAGILPILYILLFQKKATPPEKV